MLYHIKQNDWIDKKIIEIELNYLRSLKKVIIKTRLEHRA